MLASTSLSRKYILSAIGYKVKVIPPQIKEYRPLGICDPHKFARRMALLKLKSVVKKIKSKAIVVAGDTLTVVNRKILSTPQNKEEAKEMLQTISNKRVKVITALAVKTPSGKIAVSSDVAVCFVKKFPRSVINRYVAQGKWRGIGGAYALKKFFVRKKGKNLFFLYNDPWVKIIKGTADTVVGFSVNLFQRLLWNLSENSLDERKRSHR